MIRGRRILAFLLLMALAACGGGGPGTNYTVGGTVFGLTSGNTLTLQDGQGNAVTVKSIGPYAFSPPLASGTSYWVAVSAQPTGQLCAVSNPKGVVAASNISSVTVICAAAYAVHTVVTGLTNVSGLVLQDNAGDDLSLATSGSYSFKTPVVTGQPYQVTVLTQPAGHTCIVQNGSGTMTNSDVTVNVVCPWQVGYAASQALGMLAYYIDQRSGALAALPGNPFGTLNASFLGATSVVVSPGTQFLYATYLGNWAVSGYLIDPTTGALSPMAGSPFGAAYNGTIALAVDGKGRFVYAVSAGSVTSIYAFTINPSTGALTEVPGSPFPAALYSIAVDSTGKFLYGLGVAGAISAFSIDATSGALTPVAGSPFVVYPTGPGWWPPDWDPREFALDPTGNFLYLGFGNSLHSTFGAYAIESIDPSTGVLTAVAGSPFLAPGSVDSITIDPAGKYLYIGDNFDGRVFGFTIDASTGLLTAIPGPAPIVDYATVFSVDPSGRFLFALYPGVESLSFPIDPTTGALGAPTIGPAGAWIQAFSSTP